MLSNFEKRTSWECFLIYMPMGTHTRIDVVLIFFFSRWCSIMCWLNLNWGQARGKTDQPFPIVATHSMTLPCSVCGKKLASLFGLMEHKRIHTGERPYVCQVCQKRFTQKAHLVIHKRTHTGEKPYACHICHKRFAQSSHLNNHKRIHTGEKPYFCNMCNLGFSRKQRLELHILQHAQQQQHTTNNNSSSSSSGNNNSSDQANVDDVNSTITSNVKSVFSSEAEAAYSRSLLDSSQSQVSFVFFLCSHNILFSSVFLKCLFLKTHNTRYVRNVLMKRMPTFVTL